MAEISRRGLILIHTGPGKGKTTAALGTALRAAGNGMRVLILQFLKGSWHYGELDAIEALGRALGSPGEPAIVIRQMGRGFVKIGGNEADPEELLLVEEAWNDAALAILSDDWTSSCSTRSTTPAIPREAYLYLVSFDSIPVNKNQFGSCFSVSQK
jgi:cob(I)alamin adenosyltransferase